MTTCKSCGAAIIDPALLEEYRLRCKCELCGKEVRGGTQPHHLFTRGAGRMDVSFNLAALCAPCHHAIHLNAVWKPRLFGIVAAREGMTVEQLKEKLWELRRRKK